MNCDLSNATKPITSPVGESEIWYTFHTYNITWNSNYPIFSHPVYANLGVDLEVIKHNPVLDTYRWVHTYQSINISQEYFTFLLDELLWNVSMVDYADYIYQLAMIPHNLKEGETEDRKGSRVRCIQPASIRVVPGVFAPKDEEFESGGSSRNRVSSVYYVAMVVFTALAVIVH